MHRSYRCLWLGPAMTGALLLTVFAVFGFFPFGGKSITWCDMTQQVIPLMGTFGRVLSGDSSFLLDMGGCRRHEFLGRIFLFPGKPLVDFRGPGPAGVPSLCDEHSAAVRNDALRVDSSTLFPQVFSRRKAQWPSACWGLHTPFRDLR